MLADLSILARDDDGSGVTLKIIIGLVFAGIWVVSQVLSAMNKKKPTRTGDYPVVLPPEAPIPQRPTPQRPVPQRPVPQRPSPSPHTQQRQGPSRQAPPHTVQQRPMQQRPVPPLPQQAPRMEVPVKQRRETKQRAREQHARQDQDLSAPPPRRDRPPVREPEPLVSLASTPPVAERTRPQSAQTAGAGMTGARQVPSDGPNSTQRLRALLRPKNLRKEFLMTGILQPPLATRPKREIE